MLTNQVHSNALLTLIWLVKYNIGRLRDLRCGIYSCICAYMCMDVSYILAMSTQAVTCPRIAKGANLDKEHQGRAGKQSVYYQDTIVASRSPVRRNKLCGGWKILVYCRLNKEWQEMASQGWWAESCESWMATWVDQRLTLPLTWFGVHGVLSNMVSFSWQNMLSVLYNVQLRN